MFAPRRMAFVYDFSIDEEGGGGVDNEIPTTLRRSKTDCPQVCEGGEGSGGTKPGNPRNCVWGE